MAVKYDDASWHYGGEFPANLPRSAAATHIGVFLAWCIQAGLASDEFREDFGGEIALLAERRITPGAFVMTLDEKFVDDQLDDAGNAFAVAYYLGRDDDSPYLDDYADTFEDDAGGIYDIPDTWLTFERIAPQIRSRFEEWRAAGYPVYLR